MTTTSIILVTIAVIAILEGALLLLFPSELKKLARDLTKNTKTIQKIGLIEIIIALFLIALSTLMMA